MGQKRVTTDNTKPNFGKERCIVINLVRIRGNFPLFYMFILAAGRVIFIVGNSLRYLLLI